MTITNEKIFLCATNFLTNAPLDELRNSMRTQGFAVLRGLLSADFLQELRQECHGLLETHGVTRDFLMEQTARTPRKMVNVRREQIYSENGIIPALYQSELFRRIFELVAQESFQTCPFTPEEYIINALFRNGDTHGWHWDDYRYGIVIAIDTPARECGGFVQVAPDTSWNREMPSVEQAFFRSPIYSFRLDPGDAYILRTDTGLHRVSPIADGTRRVVVNMVWATPQELDRDIPHDTMETLFA